MSSYNNNNISSTRESLSTHDPISTKDFFKGMALISLVVTLVAAFFGTAGYLSHAQLPNGFSWMHAFEGMGSHGTYALFGASGAALTSSIVASLIALKQKPQKEDTNDVKVPQKKTEEPSSKEEETNTSKPQTPESKDKLDGTQPPKTINDQTKAKEEQSTSKSDSEKTSGTSPNSSPKVQRKTTNLLTELRSNERSFEEFEDLKNLAEGVNLEASSKPVRDEIQLCVKKDGSFVNEDRLLSSEEYDDKTKEKIEDIFSLVRIRAGIGKTKKPRHTYRIKGDVGQIYALSFPARIKPENIQYAYVEGADNLMCIYAKDSVTEEIYIRVYQLPKSAKLYKKEVGRDQNSTMVVLDPNKTASSESSDEQNVSQKVSLSKVEEKPLAEVKDEKPVVLKPFRPLGQLKARGRFEKKENLMMHHEGQQAVVAFNEVKEEQRIENKKETQPTADPKIDIEKDTLSTPIESFRAEEKKEEGVYVNLEGTFKLYDKTPTGTLKVEKPDEKTDYKQISDPDTF